MATRPRTRDWAEIDFYAVLGIARDASEDEVGTAYRALAKQLHPDAGAAPEQVDRFVEVTQAYDVLCDPKLRRDYDRVRTVERAVVAAGPTPGFKAAKAQRREFTRRRAWLALVGGVAIIVAGVAVGFGVLTLRANDADERARTVAVDAVRVQLDGERYVAFDANGERFVVPEPERKEPGGVGNVVTVRYDPDDPNRVIADEDRFPRDITLAIVALKLLVGGIVFAYLGSRRLFRAAR
jgi:hypothetical protein